MEPRSAGSRGVTASAGVTPTTWRLIVSGPAPGARNMAVDDALLTLAARESRPPVLRLYSFQPACLSIGYFQAAREVDRDACRAHGVDVVRRPTGGRAVLHDADFTYSLVGAAGAEPFTGGVRESYRRISEALLSALAGLGLRDLDLAPRNGRPPRTGACFDAPAAFELTAGGRKVAGSAQVRRNGAVLQHGSIPLRQERVPLYDLLRTDGAGRAAPSAGYRERTASLEALLGGVPDRDEIGGRAARAISEAFGVALVPDGLTAEEARLARELEAERYRDPAWTLRR